MANKDAVVYNEIERCLGEAARKYAENKQRGGSNGKKGARYEDYFLAFKAAQIAAELIEVPDAAWPKLRGQIAGFVDDAVIESEKSTKYFQLKNVQSITWANGEHPLETDFEYQYRLASAMAKPSPSTELVVSSADLHKSMTDSVPESIAAHTSVGLFPYFESAAAADGGVLNQYVIEHPELQECLKVLAKSENPTLDELAGVLGVLVIAFFQFPDGGKVDAIIEATRKILPHQVRTLVADVERYIKPEFKQILAEIQGLSYAVKRGYFHWEGFGTAGVFRVDCKHEDFAKFQDEIIANKPKTFDDFEGQLG